MHTLSWLLDASGLSRTHVSKSNFTRQFVSVLVSLHDWLVTFSCDVVSNIYLILTPILVLLSLVSEKRLNRLYRPIETLENAEGGLELPL